MNNNKDMPAYPSYRIEKVEKINDDEDYYYQSGDGGLSKLEDFTKAAVQGLCANPNLIQGVNPGDDYLQLIGKTARAIAEAALAELERKR